MKFGKALETNAEAMPEDWRPYVIHYKALKKRINAIVKELDDRGIPSLAIKNLLSQSTDNQHLKACIKVVLDNLEPGSEEAIAISQDEQLSKLFHDLNFLNNSASSSSSDLVEDSMSDSADPSSKRSNSLADILDDHSTTVHSLEGTNVDDDATAAAGTVDHALDMNSVNIDHPLNNQTLDANVHGPNSGTSATISSPDIPPQQTSPSTTASQPLQSPPPLSTMEPSPESSPSEPIETLITPGALHEHQSASGVSNEKTHSSPGIHTTDEDGKRVLIIELRADTEFFDQLGDEISQLSKLQEANKHGFESKVEDLSKVLTVVSSPHNKDMYTWREILSIYLDAQVFVGDQETDRSTRSSEKAQKQLQWFMTEMERSKLTQKFKQSKSKVAFKTFFQLNTELIQMKQFKEMNLMAMTKILKKHDKRTNLSASSGFPKHLQNQPFYSDNISKSLTYTIGNQLISVIPQPDDYACPICMSVAWKPIRLRCKHVFCVRCLIKAQRKNMLHCPVCRDSDSVRDANAGNLDVALMNFLKLYFPKEINEKRKESSREQAIEEMEALTGRRWSESEAACIIM
ncbi:hypothetical protein BGZ80_010760 [Entomortierella chlamydospora]|uniref:Ring-14 protein n=1 Tax=Entomortierella chlamydospora TaxID=101097 RepID=A0A9P6MUC5_9FUNG|nr:hypothetical protein BGZ79_010038 [Entomortierella chlamydospora]KAG0013921.1 hypothetical protein BGZ80_010760 [Entomortierella chlamydospora]